MQKKLIALAIAGLATAPAFAQTNVTIYGVADVTIENVKASGADVSGADDATRLSRNRVTPNSSLLGFRGAEDLGNGLKALFQFETGVNTDGNSNALFGSQRDSFVGLTSNVGTVVLGLLTSPSRNMGAKADLTPGATGIGLSTAMIGQIATPGGRGVIHTTIDDRTANAIAYVSPSFSGLTGTLAYAASGETTTTPSTPTTAERKPYIWAAGLQYENGPLYAGLGYVEARDALLVANSVRDPVTHNLISFRDKLKDWRVTGKYTLGTGTTLTALWDNTKFDVDPLGGSSADLKRDAWLLGVAQDFGPHNFFVEYARANKLKGSACDGNSCDDTKARFWSVGYNYSLSKRTMIKTYFADIRNDQNANYDFYTAPVGTAPSGANTGSLANGADPRGFGVGIRHVF